MVKGEYSFDKKLGETIAEFCQKSGGAFIKIGQILGTRYDIFSDEILIPLQKLQDNVRPADTSQIIEIIERNLKNKIENIFIDFEYKPIASASISEVYRAALRHNRQKVAIKVLSPGIGKKYENDLLLLKFFIKFLNRFNFFKEIPLIESFDLIAESLRRQTDLLTEAENNRRFQIGFNPLTRVKLPKIIHELSTDEVLVMEYFDNLKKVSELAPEESKKLVIHALKALYRMIFLNGFVHCDLHQSNFFRLKPDELVLLDTGFTAEIENNVRISFCDFFESIVHNDAKNCSRIIIKSALRLKPDFDCFAFENEIGKLINQYSAVDVRNFQISRFVLSLFKTQRKYGVYSTPHFTLPILSMLVFEGTTKKYCPELNFQKIAIPFLISALNAKAAA
ncbi:MAG: AarF/UbiB family protein [Pyrinomonadaceae bacterium]|nr:AarF/UbiB family protein [Pyrinomonadaceae bacterium]